MKSFVNGHCVGLFMKPSMARRAGHDALRFPPRPAAFSSTLAGHGAVRGAGAHFSGGDFATRIGQAHPLQKILLQVSLDLEPSIAERHRSSFILITNATIKRTAMR